MLQVNREFKTADPDVRKAALAKLKEMCEFTNDIVETRVQNRSKQRLRGRMMKLRAVLWLCFEVNHCPILVQPLMVQCY